MLALRLISLFFVLGCLIFFLVSAQIAELNPLEYITFHEEKPLKAVLVFIFLYAISVIAALPSLPINIVAGYLWGGFFGGIYSTIGVTLGGWLAFCTARFLLGKPFAEKLYGRLPQKVTNEFERHGWKYVAFARINPVIPTSALNYLLGLTKISHFSFLGVTFFFLLPPAMAISYIGASLDNFTVNASTGDETIKSILIISAAITFLASVHIVVKTLTSRIEKNENNFTCHDS